MSSWTKPVTFLSSSFLSGLRKLEIFVSGRTDISPTSQMGKLRPMRLASPPGATAAPGSSQPSPPEPTLIRSPLTSPALVLQTQRWRGLGSLCRKVCCVALPLQLLLLLCLLVLFLLPVREADRSCTLANNFARSFTLTLRYDGPPPT